MDSLTKTTNVMKKTLLVSTLLFAFGLTGYSQSLNVGVNLGYGMGAGNMVLGVSSTQNTEENVVGSLGQGIQAALNVNYMFNPNLGLELGLGVLSGEEIEITQNTDFFEESMTMKATMFRVMPGIRLSAGDDKTLAPYSKFGVAVGFGTKLVLSENYTNEFGSGFLEYEYSEGVSIGWYGAFGVGFKVSDKLSLNTELLLINQSWAPGKEKNTVNSSGSVDPSVTLEDEVSIYSNKELTTRVPFGSLGLNVGAQYRF